MRTAPKVGFVGLSHLGIVSSIAAAARGCSVVAFDPNKETIDRLNDADLIVSEPGLADAYHQHRAGVRFVIELDELMDCDVVYVSRDTAVDENSGLGIVDEIARLVMLADAALPPSTILVVLSQIRPGFMRSISMTGRPFYHQVETLVLGNALDRAVNPERIIIGCRDANEPLPESLASLLEMFDCDVIPMLYESAEVAKISINCMLASTVTTTNVLAEVCEQVGAEWAEVQSALRSDRRIGRHAYLAPGLGISGGNLERDLAAVCALAGRVPVNVQPIEAMQADSVYRLNWIIRILEEAVLPETPNPKIGILGLAYKQDTGSTKNSPALYLLSHLKSYLKQVYDPVARLPDCLSSNAKQTGNAMDVFSGADAVFVMTPWEEFRSISIKEAMQKMKKRTIVDPYGMLDGTLCTLQRAAYFTLGSGRNGEIGTG